MAAVLTAAIREVAASHPPPAAAAATGRRRRRRGIGPARTAIAVPAAPRRPPAHANGPGAPARDPSRPGRAARRGTRPGNPRPGPVPGAGRHRRPQPPHHSLHHRHRPRRHRDRARLRQARPLARPARRTTPAPGGAPGADQPHHHRAPGRTTRAVGSQITETTRTTRTPETGGHPPAADRPGDPDWCGPWSLTLPSGLELAVTCSSPSPRSTATTATSRTPTSPTTRSATSSRSAITRAPCRPAPAMPGESDFEHAVPYDQGGRTCGCNAGARSRKCHRVKQSPGWKVTQPKPGWHQWTTPRGRTYTQGPKRYPV